MLNKTYLIKMLNLLNRTEFNKYFDSMVNIYLDSE